MKIDPRKLELLKDAVAIKFRSVPKTPTDFGHLSADIFRVTGRTIGETTLKRVWGYVKSTTSPTFSTLSLLARYTGAADWDAFCARTDQAAPAIETSGFDSSAVIHTASLPIGAIMHLAWHPEKGCTLRKTANPHTFIVIESHNIKLVPGDQLDLPTVTRGISFQADNCRRAGDLLGSYTASGAGLAAVTIE